MNKPTLYPLESGYTLIRFSRECFAQIPPGFNKDRIPDEYIFNAAWNRDRINDWWRKHRSQMPDSYD